MIDNQKILFKFIQINTNINLPEKFKSEFKHKLNDY